MASKIERRVAAGAAALALSVAGAEAIRRDSSDDTVAEHVDVHHEQSSDTDTDKAKANQREHTPTISIDGQLAGKDPDFNRLLEDGYKDYEVTVDGDTVLVYNNNNGHEELQLIRDGNRWKAEIKFEKGFMDQWAKDAQFVVHEPMVAADDITGALDELDALKEMGRDWMRIHTSAESTLFNFGADFDINIDALQTKQAEEERAYREVVLHSGNPFIREPAAD